MSKHTPGPWGVGQSNGYNANGIYQHAGDALEDKSICLVYGIAQNRSVSQITGHDTGIHNAHLIAAAPELYKALDELVELEKSDLTGPEWKREIIAKIRQAERALGKARGEE